MPSPSQNEDDGIKKFVVDVFCPLKRDANGNRREQIPRDVREFRLAKVALIPIVAGKRTFVSFDVVFGEMDKAFLVSCSNPLVEAIKTSVTRNRLTSNEINKSSSGYGTRRRIVHCWTPKYCVS
jgi:hypothetical protein